MAARAGMRGKSAATGRKAASKPPARTTAKAAAKRGTAASGSASPARGLAQKVQPDEQLAAVVGKQPLPRTQLVKKFWEYVKSKGLQAENDRRKITADDKLRPLFGGKRQITMFDVSRLLAQHAH